MSTPARPTVNTLVEVSLAGGTSFDLRVEDVTDGRICLAAPVPPDLSVQPDAGDPLTVRWTAGARGRYSLPATVVTATRTGVPVWVVQPAGEPAVEQHRRFVRGGGGEAVRMRRDGAPLAASVDGHVVDLGEASVRARFPRLDVGPGDLVIIQMALGATVLPAHGAVRHVDQLPAGHGVEAVVVYELGESLAQLIRRYVMGQQLRARGTVHGY